MKLKRNGFALITSLLVLGVLAMLAFGATILANMNLRVAENARTNLVASTHAQEGLDISFIATARAYRSWLEREIASGGSPGTLTGTMLFDDALALMPHTEDYSLLGFETFTTVPGDPSRATIVVAVRGSGPRNAQHVSRARIETTYNAIGGGNPGEFAEGFVTDGMIDFNGTGSYDINFYAKSKIEVNGNSTLGAGYIAESLGECKIGKTTCVTLPQDAAKNLPLFNWHRYSLALLNDPTALLVDAENPDAVNLSATSRLVIPIASADPIPQLQATVDLSAISPSDGTPGSSGVACSRVVPRSQSSLTLNSSDVGGTICLEPGASVVVSGTATDLFIVGDESTSVNLSGASQPPGSDPTLMGVAVIAGTVNLTDGGQNKHNPMNLSGRNFVYSYNSIDFDKGILASNPSGVEGAYARTIIASQGDIDMNGAGNSDIVNSVFWAAGSWCINGRIGTFRGTVLSNVDASSTGDGCVGDTHGIRGNGSITDAGLPDGIDVNVPGGGTPELDLQTVGIRVLAKTP